MMPSVCAAIGISSGKSTFALEIVSEPLLVELGTFNPLFGIGKFGAWF